MAAKTSTTTHDARTGSRATSPASRFTAIALTGLGVIAIAACAVLLSYNGIYQIARQGSVDPRYAHIYPGAFTLLLLMAFWAAYVLHDAPRIRRLGVDAIILALILLAAFASALEPLGYTLTPKAAVAVVALAPWAALLIAFRIWLWMVSHLRGDHSGGQARGSGPTDGTDNGDTAPLPAEPMPRPVDPDGAAEPTESRSGEHENVPSPPMQLWPRTSSAPTSSVRVLDPGTSKTRNEARPPHHTPTPEDDTTPEDPAEPSESPAPRRDDVSSSRSTPESESETAAPESATDPVPAADDPDTSTAPTSAEADPTDSATTRPGAADGSPTLGEQLRRALLPEGPPDPAGTATDDAGTAPVPPLPKRTPRTERNSAEEPTEVPEPAETPVTDGTPVAGEDDGDEGESETAAPAGATDPASPAEPAEDGFVHELPPDDPTSDEADIRGEWTPEPEREASGTEPEAEPETDEAPRLTKRPIVLRPRRRPTEDFPPAPPSGRVRSEPTPPESPQE
ncbi:hypothetical protein [Halostreptopolyspora alba]|uniref:DUF2637 domain-containing protein n=1 Tax=Halostreptopolyspora alba TaxID=2487137 RepID=A0A3N0E848_9ACTN|nr:hypothetical protein EFW17_14175 [Nocardiopsaceae bacterium YIM 96095]